MGVGEVAGSERDEVAVGPQVGLEVGDRLPVLADAEGEGDFAAGEAVGGHVDLVAVDGGRPCRLVDRLG